MEGAPALLAENHVSAGWQRWCCDLLAFPGACVSRGQTAPTPLYEIFFFFSLIFRLFISAFLAWAARFESGGAVTWRDHLFLCWQAGGVGATEEGCSFYAAVPYASSLSG